MCNVGNLFTSLILRKVKLVSEIKTRLSMTQSVTISFLLLQIVTNICPCDVKDYHPLMLVQNREQYRTIVKAVRLTLDPTTWRGRSGMMLRGEILGFSTTERSELMYDVCIHQFTCLSFMSGLSPHGMTGRNHEIREQKDKVADIGNCFKLFLSSANVTNDGGTS